MDAGGTSDLAVAIIAAGAALAGAVIGGLITAISTYRLEDKKQCFERARDDARAGEARESDRRRALATARVSRGRYSTARVALRRALRTGGWWPDSGPNMQLPERLPTEQWITLAAHLEPLESEMLDRAEFAIAGVWDLRASDPTFGPASRDLCETALQAVLDARGALGRIGESPPDDETPTDSQGD